MMHHTPKASGYSAPAPSASVFALAEPDFSDPLPPVTRAALDWYGDDFIERDPVTGCAIGGAFRDERVPFAAE